MSNTNTDTTATNTADNTDTVTQTTDTSANKTPDARTNEPVAEEIAEENNVSEAPTLEQALEQIATLETEVKDAKARANADMYNFQKRMERETENSKKFAVERFAKDILEVVDNLERAITAAEEAGEIGAILDGVMLTHKTLIAALQKHKVDVVDPSGAAFNADLHEAVGIDPSAESGMVGNVLQKGYTLDGRLLRPAMVTVGQ